MSLRLRLFKFLWNLYPPFFFSGIHIRYVAPDWKEVIVELRKHFWTRNYVGTAFGGSLYAACDPFYMLMLIKILGVKDYIVWDKGAVIDFKKPGRSTITYRFMLTDQKIEGLLKEVEEKGKVLPEFTVNGVDTQGEVVVSIRKILYVRKKVTS